MMPVGAARRAWRAKSAELAVAAYRHRVRRHLGHAGQRRPLATRLQGFNAYADGTVENHQRIHPDYASNVQLLWTAADFDRLARQRVPEAMFHNGRSRLLRLQHGLATRRAPPARPAGPSRPPAAPSTSRVTAGSTTPRATTGAPPGGPTSSASTRTRRCTRTTSAPPAGPPPGPGQARERRSGAGGEQRRRRRPHLLGRPGPSPRQQDTYPGREEYAAQNLATAWLALYVGQIGVPAARPWHAAGAGRHREGARRPGGTARALTRPALVDTVEGGSAMTLVVGAAIVRDGTLLAARRTGPPEAAGRWELPGGKVEPGESPDAARWCARSPRSSAARVAVERLARGRAADRDAPRPPGRALPPRRRRAAARRRPRRAALARPERARRGRLARARPTLPAGAVGHCS